MRVVECRVTACASLRQVEGVVVSKKMFRQGLESTFMVKRDGRVELLVKCARFNSLNSQGSRYFLLGVYHCGGTCLGVVVSSLSFLLNDSPRLPHAGAGKPKAFAQVVSPT